MLRDLDTDKYGEKLMTFKIFLFVDLQKQH